MKAHRDPLPLAGKRVLLAEDEPNARAVLSRVLRAMGCDVVEAADGGRMLVAVTSEYKDGHDPAGLDLIVTDVRMPVVDGLDVLRALRAARWATPVIVVTGDDGAAVREATSRLGATVLPKPLDIGALEAAVLRLLVPPRSSPRRSAPAAAPWSS